jgi:hypothetical protein
MHFLNNSYGHSNSINQDLSFIVKLSSELIQKICNLCLMSDIMSCSRIKQVKI